MARTVVIPPTVDDADRNYDEAPISNAVPRSATAPGSNSIVVITDVDPITVTTSAESPDPDTASVIR